MKILKVRVVDFDLGKEITRKKRHIRNEIRKEKEKEVKRQEQIKVRKANMLLKDLEELLARSETLRQQVEIIYENPT